MDEEDLDRIAGRLGAAAPFEVDWDAYATQVIGRIARSERQRRRRGWWVTLAGTLAGAAAAWLVAVHLTGTRNIGPGADVQERVAIFPQQERPVEPVSGASPANRIEELPVLFCVRKPGTPYVLRSVSAADESLGPFVKRTTDVDGRVSEIRFYGFTPEGAETGGFIIIGEEGRPLPARPNMGL